LDPDQQPSLQDAPDPTEYSHPPLLKALTTPGCFLNRGQLPPRERAPARARRMTELYHVLRRPRNSGIGGRAAERGNVSCDSDVGIVHSSETANQATVRLGGRTGDYPR